MLTDKELERLAQPIIDIFNQMEIELIEEVASRFDRYDKVGGSLEWQVKMLEKMGVLNQALIRIISANTNKTEQEITKMLKAAGMANFSQEEIDKAYDAGVLPVTYAEAVKSPVLAAIIRDTEIDTNSTVKMIKTKALESAKQAYMDAINKAYVETASGLRSYDEAIFRALKEMGSSGIKGATYNRRGRNGSVIQVQYSLEGTVRRDVVTAVNSLANRVSIENAKNMGYEYVEVSQHYSARTGDGGHNHTNHAWWQGKVYKLNGSDDKYDNLEEVTGLGKIDGLGGVNCRHRTYPFIPGISKPHTHIPEDENKPVFKANQQLRGLEREIRKLRKEYAAIKQIGTADEKKAAKQAILKKSDEIDAFCKRHGMKRQFNREIVAEL